MISRLPSAHWWAQWGLSRSLLNQTKQEGTTTKWGSLGQGRTPFRKDKQDPVHVLMDILLSGLQSDNLDCALPSPSATYFSTTATLLFKGTRAITQSHFWVQLEHHQLAGSWPCPWGANHCLLSATEIHVARLICFSACQKTNPLTHISTFTSKNSWNWEYLLAVTKTQTSHQLLSPSALF